MSSGSTYDYVTVSGKREGRSLVCCVDSLGAHQSLPCHQASVQWSLPPTQVTSDTVASQPPLYYSHRFMAHR